MTKITDKVKALPPGASFASLEFFPPKTAPGFANLRERLGRMERALRPLFVNVTWGAGGSTEHKSLELAELCQRDLGLTTCLHITCTNMRRSVLDRTLAKAKELGVRNILALRGDPPRESEYLESVDDDEQQQQQQQQQDDDNIDKSFKFTWAVDLVRYIRQQYGDYFCIGVAAYPEGHADDSHPVGQSLQHDLPYLVEKVQAGADFIMTQLFFDVERYEAFETLLLNHPSGAFKDTVILPGLMPIQSYQMIKRTTRLSHASLPHHIQERLDSVKADDEKVKEAGVEVICDIIRRLQTFKSRTSPGKPQGFHFYTLNLEKAVSFILERTKLIPDVSASTPIEYDEVFEDDDEPTTSAPQGPAIQVDAPSSATSLQPPPPSAARPPAHRVSAYKKDRRMSSIGSDPRNRVIISGSTAVHPDYEATASDAALRAEDVNTRANTLAISEGVGVLGRAATWDDFPNGRWGDARSPAYGEIDGYGVSLHMSHHEARQLWGQPTTTQDISDIFTRHIRGEVRAIPWTEEELSAESSAIQQQLLQLNQKGWWTVASQPAVNGIRSSDATFGWGPPNGFVFQKAFVEFFLPSSDWAKLQVKLEKLAEKETVCFYAANAKGAFISSDASGGIHRLTGTLDQTSISDTKKTPAINSTSTVPTNNSTNAVTWGVFPGKEIVTPTIIEEVSFKAWADEAFTIWKEWAVVYAKTSPASEKLLLGLYKDLWLVNVIHHEYIDKEALWDVVLAD